MLVLSLTLHTPQYIKSFAFVSSLEGIAEVRVFVLTLLHEFLEVALALSLHIALLQVLAHLLATRLAWSDKGLVLPECFASE